MTRRQVENIKEEYDVKAPAFTPLGQSAVIVRITSYDYKRPCGTLTGPNWGKPVSFNSLMQLLLAMDAFMDRENLPQRAEEHRTFGAAAPPQTPEEGSEEAEPLATFQIRVLFRQNASWQGSLVWVEKNMDAQFRSVMELVRLMDSALSAGKGE
nr:hypothetical protein [uncultured Oscillibacter sp.]